MSLSILSELRVGMGIPPIVEMMEAGVPLCLSVDTMAASDNSDFFAVLRDPRGARARPVTRTRSSTSPTRSCATARSTAPAPSGLGDVAGSLTPGKRADVIVLRGADLNLAPLNVPDGQVVLAAQPRNVEHVWIDGVARKRDGELVGVDPARLVADARSGGRRAQRAPRATAHVIG